MSKLMKGATAEPEASFPLPLTILTTLLSVCAMAVVFWGAVANFTRPTSLTDLILLTALAVATLPLTVALPTTGTLVIFGETPLMAVAMMYGTSACVLATALYGLAVALMCARHRRSWKVSLLAFCQLVCGAALYSAGYQLTKPNDPDHFAATGFAVTVMALVSFAFSSTLAAAAASWTSGGRWAAIWTRGHLPLALNSLFSGVGATLIALFFDNVPFIILAAAPFLSWGYTILLKARLSRANAS